MSLTNEQMKPNRFAKWQDARSKLSAILKHIERGGRVVIATYTKATAYDARHAELFIAKRSGLYVKRGKQYDCIDYCAIRFIDNEKARKSTTPHHPMDCIHSHCNCVDILLPSTDNVDPPPSS